MFLQALGILQEQQNNLAMSNILRFNKPVVQKFYKQIGDPQAANSILDPFTCSTLDCNGHQGTKFDISSISLPKYPDNWFVGPNPTMNHFALSKTDISWLMHLYPKNTKNPPVITISWTNPMPEPWQAAWVENIVMKTFEPIIGVKWIFPKIETFSGGSECVIN